MKRVELLKQMTFGMEVAEQETNELENYFVETDDWARIASGKVDIVRGEKGAGKSAIYSLLMKRVNEFFDRNILLIAAENPRGDTVFKDLVPDPPTTEAEFIVLWKLYIVSIIAHRLREFEINNEHAAKVYKALEDAKLLEREFSLAGLLRRAQEYARRILKAEAIEGGITFDPATQMPNGIVGQIVLKEPTRELRKAGAISVDNLFSELNAALDKTKFKVWVLLDKY